MDGSTEGTEGIEDVVRRHFAAGGSAEHYGGSAEERGTGMGRTSTRGALLAAGAAAAGTTTGTCFDFATGTPTSASPLVNRRDRWVTLP